MLKFCSLYSGSSGNCLFACAKQTKILIDAGLSGKKIIDALGSIGEDPGELSGILISHEHVDHIRGAGILSRKLDIPIYANALTWNSMHNLIGDISDHNIKYFNTNTDLIVGDFLVHPFAIPHDAAEPVGFNIYGEDRKISIATDIGHMTEAIVGRLESSDLILLESNHDVNMLMSGAYPYYLKKRIAGDYGHLSNENATKVISRLISMGTKKFILGHLSNENNYPDLAYITVKNVLDNMKMVIGEDIELDIARRDCVGRVVNL